MLLPAGCVSVCVCVYAGPHGEFLRKKTHRHRGLLHSREGVFIAPASKILPSPRRVYEYWHGAAVAPAASAEEDEMEDREQEERERERGSSAREGPHLLPGRESKREREREREDRSAMIYKGFVSAAALRHTSRRKY